VDRSDRNLERERRAVSACNQTLLRAVDEGALLHDICRIVCDDAGYRMAWVGYAEREEQKRVFPVAWAGFEDGYLQALDITWSDTERGRGPTGTAIRTGATTFIRDFQADPSVALWRERAAQRGYRCSISLALKDANGTPFGALTIYASEPDSFTPAEIELLEELAGDLAFGIVVLRARKEQARAEESLATSARALRTLSSVNEALVRADSEERLLQDVCEAVIANQDYAVAWVGYAMHDESKSVVPVAQAGSETGILDGLFVSWAEGPFGNGAIGRSIREQRTVVVRSMASDESMSPWTETVVKWGLESVVSLPLLRSDDAAYGAIVIYSHDGEAFAPEEVALLTNMAEDLSYGIQALKSRQLREDAERDLITANDHLQRLLKSITATVGRVVEVRDPYTQGHQQRVAALAAQIAEEMGLPKKERDAIEMGALVHDVGKLAVPAEILNKPGVLSDVEFHLIQCHPKTGYDILSDIDFGLPVAEMVLHHHERMDGSGYPDGLSGDRIPMADRVLAAADTVEAMASHRPYRPALGLEAAIRELTDHSEKYDSSVVAACVSLFEAGAIDL
jgi:putative nucleotidyltransferase with HDIG domain